jgi:hypothetical protein
MVTIPVGAQGADAPPPEPCLVCAANVFRPGAGEITQHWNRAGGHVRIGWTCSPEHARMVEACRDDRGHLRARRSYARPYRPRKKADA